MEDDIEILKKIIDILDNSEDILSYKKIKKEINILDDQKIKNLLTKLKAKNYIDSSRGNKGGYFLLDNISKDSKKELEEII